MLKVTERITCTADDGRRIIVEMHQEVRKLVNLDGTTEELALSAKHPKLTNGTQVRYGDDDGVFILPDGTIIRAE